MISWRACMIASSHGPHAHQLAYVNMMWLQKGEHLFLTHVIDSAATGMGKGAHKSITSPTHPRPPASAPHPPLPHLPLLLPLTPLPSRRGRSEKDAAMPLFRKFDPKKVRKMPISLLCFTVPRHLRPTLPHCCHAMLPPPPASAFRSMAKPASTCGKVVRAAPRPPPWCPSVKCLSRASFSIRYELVCDAGRRAADAYLGLSLL